MEDWRDLVFSDAHCHLGSRQFDGDRDETVKRMLESGVRKALIICCSEHDLLEGAKLRDSNPGFRLACSIHPQDLEEDSSPERLEKLRNDVLGSRADMIGETGLDYYSHPHTKEEQMSFFRAQLEMAADLGLPVDVHTRRAAADTLETLKRYPVRGIIHSYSGSAEMAELYVKQGFCISFGASVLFKGAKKPAEVIAGMPADRLLIETDAPYQSPVRGHRHEPADIVAIYEAVSRIRKTELRDLTRQVDENWERVFSR
ncbi:MAG: TatD family hydrolase [Oscillospiraceae bacterium]|nr:TatD family hydrolase [Oscillospiraceae bacterium]